MLKPAFPKYVLLLISLLFLISSRIQTSGSSSPLPSSCPSSWLPRLVSSLIQSSLSLLHLALPLLLFNPAPLPGPALRLPSSLWIWLGWSLVINADVLTLRCGYVLLGLDQGQAETYLVLLSSHRNPQSIMKWERSLLPAILHSSYAPSTAHLISPFNLIETFSPIKAHCQTTENFITGTALVQCF